MNSPRSQKFDAFDATIGRELKNWATRQHAPASIRATLLEEAAVRAKKPAAGSAHRRNTFVKRLQVWLVGPTSVRGPQLSYSDLTQWLSSQAAWHNLGNDRRAVRFVC